MRGSTSRSEIHPWGVSAGRPAFETTCGRQRLEHLRRRGLDQNRELEFRLCNRRILGTQGIPSTLADGLQIPEAHPVRVVHPSAGALRLHESRMRDAEVREVARVLDLPSCARLPVEQWPLKGNA